MIKNKKILVGIDSVDIERIEKSMKNPIFLKNFFSQNERNFFENRNNNIKTIAANFCVKEAFSKAIGTGIRNFSLDEVEILRDDFGAPYIDFYGKAKKIVSDLAVDFSVSITHTDTVATAIVIGYKSK